MRTFKVVSSNPSNEGKSFVTKLQCKTEINHPIFGVKSKTETYYVSGSKQVTVPTIELDIKEFRVAEYPFLNEETGEEIMLKWLHLK